MQIDAFNTLNFPRHSFFWARKHGRRIANQNKTRSKSFLKSPFLQQRCIIAPSPVIGCIIYAIWWVDLFILICIWQTNRNASVWIIGDLWSISKWIRSVFVGGVNFGRFLYVWWFCFRMTLKIFVCVIFLFTNM